MLARDAAAIVRIQTDVDQSDRLRGGRAAGPSNAGDTQTDRDPTALSHALGHRSRHFRTHRTIPFNSISRDTEQVDLGLVAVTDNSPVHIS